jgi:hypothetical protein
LEGSFSEAQVVALYEREKALFGESGEVKTALPRIQRAG